MSADNTPAKNQTQAAAKGAAKPKIARVRSKVGEMVHLHTNETIGEVEKKIEIDAFAQAQIDAGKWEIVAD